MLQSLYLIKQNPSPSKSHKEKHGKTVCCLAPRGTMKLSSNSFDRSRTVSKTCRVCQSSVLGDFTFMLSLLHSIHVSSNRVISCHLYFSCYTQCTERPSHKVRSGYNASIHASLGSCATKGCNGSLSVCWPLNKSTDVNMRTRDGRQTARALPKKMDGYLLLLAVSTIWHVSFQRIMVCFREYHKYSCIIIYYI